MSFAISVLGCMLLLAPATVAAQSDSRSRTSSAGIKVGQVVNVEAITGVKRTGKVIRVSSDSLYFRRGAVGINSVTRMRVRERTRARPYGIIGAVAGGVFLGMAGYSLNGLDDSANRCSGLHCAALPGAAIGTVAGYGVGALLGSTWSTWRDVPLPLNERVPTGK